MLNKLWTRVNQALSESERAAEEPRADAVQLATAALLVEVARADADFDPDEFTTLLDLIESHFRLPPNDAALLSDLAGERVEDSVSLREFTSVLHASLKPAEKVRVVDLLWRVAYADGRLDMYEDALVLKISDLLYVSRSDVMRLKHKAGGTAS